MNEPRSLQGEYAGFVSRAIAFGIDMAIVAGVAALLSWILVRPLELFGFQISTCTSLQNLGGFKDAWCYVYIFLLPFVIGFSIVSYYVLFWFLTGWTIGKGVMGLRVVTTDGQPLKLRRALLRYIGYFVSLVPLGAGFFWVLLSDSRQGWHDKMARTYVLYAWEARENELILDRLQRYAEKVEQRHLDDEKSRLLPAPTDRVEVEIIDAQATVAEPTTSQSETRTAPVPSDADGAV